MCNLYSQTTHHQAVIRLFQIGHNRAEQIAPQPAIFPANDAPVIRLDKSRPLFAFAGIWRSYKGPLKKDGEAEKVDVYSFMTTAPNALVAEIHPKRMPVMLTKEEEWERWLTGSPDEARSLVRSYPADDMMIVQSGTERSDLI